LKEAAHLWLSQALPPQLQKQNSVSKHENQS
jgi:hypothetical protein